jgi:outer membrane protein OmpA-like peptidoglycan-associated protein
MSKRNVAWVGVVAILFLAAAGCITKKTFRKNVEQTDSRVSEVESAIEANERRIGDVDRKVATVGQDAEEALDIGNDALDKADRAAMEAEKALKGKLIWSETLNDDKVKFGLNKSALTTDAKTALDDVVDKVKSYGKAVYIEIEGHTDSSGNPTYNAKLSEQRALEVRNYFNEQGIPLHAMNIIGLGESKPVADNKTSNGRAQNRRVVIKVLE